MKRRVRDLSSLNYDCTRNRASDSEEDKRITVSKERRISGEWERREREHEG